MATILPVRLFFRPPAGWVTKPPDEAGVPGAAFVAGYPASKENGVIANITLSGELRPDSSSLTEIAKSEISQARKGFLAVQVVERREIGDPDAPGVVQAAKVLVDRDGTALRLIMIGVYMAIWEPGDLRKRVVVMVALTATPSQLTRVIGDFEGFLRSIRPARPGEVSD